MKIVGIDPSLRATGVAVVFNGAVATDVIRPEKRKQAPKGWEEQIDRIDELLFGVMLWAGTADLVAMEEASKRSVGGLQEERHWLRGIVLRTLRHKGIPCAMVSPKTLKVYACDNGNAKKEDMLAAAEQYFPDVEVEDDNAADALWLAALLARRMGVTVDNVPVRHERAFSGVAWPDITRAA